MEHITFDRLTKLIGQPASRRGGFRAALGALLALGSRQVLVTEPAKARRRHLRAEACIPTGKPCPSKKPRGHDKHGKARTLSCNQCCQRHVATVNGEQQCACQPNGQPCGQTIECCLGVCTNGVCIANTPAPPPPPPPCTPLGSACTGTTTVCCAGSCGLRVETSICCLPSGGACADASQCCNIDGIPASCFSGTCQLT